MVKHGSKSVIPGSDDQSWPPNKSDVCVPKCVNVKILSYSIIIPADLLVYGTNKDRESCQILPKSTDKCVTPKNSAIQHKSEGWKRYLGVFYTLFSTCMLSLSANSLKLVSHIHPLTIGTYAFPVSTLLSVPFIWYTMKMEKKSVMENILPLRKHKKVLFFMVVRAVLSVLIQGGFILSFRYITVADARTILASSVITVNLFGCLCLGEKFGFVPIIVALIALCGIGVITRPPILTGAEGFDSNTLIGVSIAIGCMLIVTIIILSLRVLQNVHHGVLNLSLCCLAFVSILPFAIAFDKWQPPENEWDIIKIAVVGATFLYGNTFLKLALQVEQAGIVSLIRTSEVIFTFGWQMLLLQVYPDLISLVGAVLVVTGVVVVTLRKFVASLDSENNWKKRLAFLLL